MGSGTGDNTSSTWREPRGNWRADLDKLPRDVAWRIRWELVEQFDAHLDGCHGKCVLRQPDLAQIVAHSLMKFDRVRYVLTDFVVMPNHVHVLAAFPTEDAMRRQVSAWKRFQAVKVNRAIGESGSFWQREDFDHLVRSYEQFERLRQYVANNPTRAHLKPGEFIHGSSRSIVVR
jgi:type I restriction enzyme R subunit